jgi:1A family penicillin-binding protein
MHIVMRRLARRRGRTNFHRKYLTRILRKANVSFRRVSRFFVSRLPSILNRLQARLTPPQPTRIYVRGLFDEHINWVRTARLVIVLGGFCSIVIVLSHICHRAYVFYITLPSPREIGTRNYALTTHIYDRNGELLYQFYREQNRTPVRLKDLPEYVAHATVAIEDKNFFRHRGISPIGGIARAIKEMITRSNEGGLQGGSTITQQLVKTALLSSERTLERKIKEAIIALQTEKMFSKRKILEMYLNQVPYGGSAYGIESASRIYFDKSAQDLTLSEAALLAGLPQAPSRYSPFTDPEAALERRNLVLAAMREQGYITRVQYIQAMNEQPVFANPDTTIAAPHFVFYVKNYLSRFFDDAQLERAGYSVYTTLDLTIQREAEKILREELDRVRGLNITNGAILITNPRTGEILSMVGSSDYFAQNNYGAYNVTTALRQPGSSIKPLLYAMSLENGFTAASIIADVPTTFRIKGVSEVYRPSNYDGRFHGLVTLRLALANSYNIPAVKVIERLGVVPFMQFAKRMGIDTWERPENYGLSLALGGGEVTMVDMAEGYGAIANLGVRTNLRPIAYLQDRQQQTLTIDDINTQRVIDPAVAYIIADILADNRARTSAFGQNSKLEIPGFTVAVKTGTTNEKKDNWTIGFTPEYLVVVWVGNNDGTPMHKRLVSGITGAAPIWHRVMAYLLSRNGETSNRWYDRPSHVVTKRCFGRDELFIAGSERNVVCSIPSSADTAKNER